MTPKPLRALPARAACALAAAALALISCGREPTRPDGAEPPAVRLSQNIGFIAEFPPGLARFQAAGGSGVAFTRVRIVLRHADGSLALDTVVNFPAGATELPVTLTVPLPPSAPASGVPLALNLKYVNAAGDTVFSGGPVTVTAVPTTPGAGPPPPSQVSIPITYTGPGANAVAVRISPRALTVAPNAAFSFSAQALDASGAVIPNTPIVFNSADPVVASINAATGAGTAGPARGSVEIMAQLLTGPADVATLSIVPPPAQLGLVSGGGQSANVNAQLAQPVIVRVTASDGVGSPGVTVTFAAGSGGSVGTASATTDASGNASTTWRLGAAPGTQTLTVTSAGLAGSPLSVTATARPLDPVRLEVTTQPPASTAAGAPFGLVVRAVDPTGTLTPSFTGTVSLALGAGAPAGALLSGTTSSAAVAGVATFTDLRLTVPGTYTLVASTPTLAGVTSASFTIVPGPTASLAFQNYPIVGATAGATLDPITVVARDAFNNPVTTFTGAVTLSVMSAAAVADSSTANVLLSGPVTVNAVAGVATFSNLQLVVAGRYALSASASGATPAVGPAFTITPGAAAALSLVSGGGQSGPGGVALANPIVVKVSDAFGNGVGGVAVTFAPPTGNGTVNPPTAVSGAGSGLAQTTWTLGGAAGAKTLNVSGSGVLPNPLVVTATATTSAGVARVWTGATSTAWTVATNWSPAGAPGTADDITIPVTATAPAISAPATIGSLVVASGATLTNTSTLSIGGSLDASGTIVGGGMVVLNGATGTVKGNVTGNVTVAAGTYSLIADFNLTGTLTINGTGTLDVNNNDLFVDGHLVTAASGRLIMPTGGSVDVTGNATFGGASTAGQMIAGVINVRGNFTATGSSFSASGAHALKLNGSAGTQTLTFTAPVAGQGINHLVVDQGAAKVMAGAPQIMGDVSLLFNTAPVTGAATVRIGGNFSDDTPFGADSTGAGGWRVANTEFFGSGKAINTGYLMSNVLVSGSVSFTTQPPSLRSGNSAAAQGDVARLTNPGSVALYGNLSVSGTSGLLTLDWDNVYVYGNFATASGGRLSMTDASGSLWISGSASFGGGSTAGLLTAGQLTVTENFTQGGGSATAFAPAATFYTYIGAYYAFNAQVGAPARRDPRLGARAEAAAGRGRQSARSDDLRRMRAASLAMFEERRRIGEAGRAQAMRWRATSDSRMPAPTTQLAYTYTGTSTVTFANPASSAFGHLYLAGPNMVLGSDINVLGRFETGFSQSFQVASSGSARVLTSRGADVRNLTFNNVRWVVLDGDYIGAMDYVSFVNMDPAVDQFSISRTADEQAMYYYLYWWSFSTTPTTGKYVRATDTNGGTPVIVYMEDPRPTTHNGFVATSGGAQIQNWPQTFAWTGLSTTTDAWSDGANWSTGYQPGLYDDVVIPAGTPRNPNLGIADGHVHNLTIGAGKVIYTSCQELWVHGNLVAPLDATAQSTCEGDGIKLVGDGSGANTVVGRFDVVYVLAPYRVAGTGNQLIANDALYILGGDLMVNGGRVDASYLSTGDNGTLTMNNAADQVFVGSSGASFGGGSTSGRLTAGAITLANNGGIVAYPATSTSSFAPSGSHTVVISGMSGVDFTGATASAFNHVDILAGGTLQLNSAVTVNGTLTRGAGAASVGITGLGGTTAHPLTVNSLAGFAVGSPTTVTNVQILLGNGPSAVFNSVTFSGYDSGFSAGSIFSVNRTGGPLTFTGLNFAAAGFSPGPTRYFVFNSGSANITIAGATPSPGIAGTHYSTGGTGTVTWP